MVRLTDSSSHKTFNFMYCNGGLSNAGTFKIGFRFLELPVGAPDAYLNLSQNQTIPDPASCASAIVNCTAFTTAYDCNTFDSDFNANTGQVILNPDRALNETNYDNNEWASSPNVTGTNGTIYIQLQWYQNHSPIIGAGISLYRNSSNVGFGEGFSGHKVTDANGRVTFGGMPVPQAYVLVPWGYDSDSQPFSLSSVSSVTLNANLVVGIFPFDWTPNSTTVIDAYRNDSSSGNLVLQESESTPAIPGIYFHNLWPGQAYTFNMSGYSLKLYTDSHATVPLANNTFVLDGPKSFYAKLS